MKDIIIEIQIWKGIYKPYISDYKINLRNRIGSILSKDKEGLFGITLCKRSNLN